MQDMQYGLNILGASDKELIVMCLEKLEKIEQLLKDNKPEEAKAGVAGVAGVEKVITKTPTKTVQINKTK